MSSDGSTYVTGRGNNCIQKFTSEGVFVSQWGTEGTGDGSPVLPGTLTENFRFLTRELGMPSLNFHGLRHAFATLALMTGIPAKVVSEHLGHSSVTITLDTYSHVLPDMQDELANAVANLLKRESQLD